MLTGQNGHSVPRPEGGAAGIPAPDVLPLNGGSFNGLGGRVLCEQPDKSMAMAASSGIERHDRERPVAMAGGIIVARGERRPLRCPVPPFGDACRDPMPRNGR